MKKNCANCVHFNYYEGNECEGEGPNGYYCDKRENAFKKMNASDGDNYIERSKRCHEPMKTSDL